MIGNILWRIFDFSKPLLVLLVPIAILVVLLHAVAIKIKIVNNTGQTLYAVGSFPHPSAREFDVPPNSEFQLVHFSGPAGSFPVFVSTSPDKSNRTQVGGVSFSTFGLPWYCRFRFEFQPDGRIVESGGCPF